MLLRLDGISPQALTPSVTKSTQALLVRKHGPHRQELCEGPCEASLTHLREAALL